MISIGSDITGPVIAYMTWGSHNPKVPALFWIFGAYGLD